MGNPFRCVACRNDKFFQKRGQLTTSAAQLFGLAWASPMAHCVICSDCGYIHWFMPTRDE